MNDYLYEQLSNCTTRELIEILEEVSGMRMHHYSDGSCSRWFVTVFQEVFDKQTLGFIFDNNWGVTPYYMALPLVVNFDEESFLQGGYCYECNTQVSCTHKKAKCPYCFGYIECT